MLKIFDKSLSSSVRGSNNCPGSTFVVSNNGVTFKPKITNAKNKREFRFSFFTFPKRINEIKTVEQNKNFVQ